MWFSMVNLLLNFFLFQEAGKEKLLNTLQEERKKVMHVVMLSCSYTQNIILK